MLGTLLSQHPHLHTTSTSMVNEFIREITSFQVGQSLYFDLFDDTSPLWGTLRGILFGYYENVSNKVIIEKGRGWLRKVGVTEKFLGEKPKLLAPVRDIPEVISSFILLAERIGPTSQVHQELAKRDREVNPWTLSRVIWERYVYSDWKNLKAAHETHPECFHFVEYQELVEKTQKVLQKVHNFIGVEPMEVESNGLINPTPENDALYGMPGLHDVRAEVKRYSPSPEEVLGEECYAFWRKQQLEFWRG